MFPHLVGAYGKGFDGALHGHLAKITAFGDVLAEANRAGKGIDDLKALSCWHSNKHPAIVGAEINGGKRRAAALPIVAGPSSAMVPSASGHNILLSVFVARADKGVVRDISYCSYNVVLLLPQIAPDAKTLAVKIYISNSIKGHFRQFWAWVCPIVDVLVPQIAKGNATDNANGV